MNTLQRIFPDPLALRRVEVTTTLQMACLVHVARCGLQGSCATSTANALGIKEGQASENFRRLKAKGLLKEYTHKTTRGTAALCVVTKKAWEALTSPAEYDLFPDADKAITE